MSRRSVQPFERGAGLSGLGDLVAVREERAPDLVAGHQAQLAQHEQQIADPGR